MLEAVRTSETSANFYEPRQGSIPEDSYIQVKCKLLGGFHLSYKLK
jgi:hypothetical protein